MLIPSQSKTKRCYSYTGQEKDGFFYPLHVAAEMGHKNLTILLVKAGADVHAVDYRYVYLHSLIALSTPDPR